ncbi:MAG TPA: hypothetical protein VNQ90_05680 [Chthoniobacteraceae bacterium]|nr:hypothetical protein [Chthoniobacteraceae bacterium]
MAKEFQIAQRRYRITWKTVVSVAAGAFLIVTGIVVIPTMVMAGIGLGLIVIGLILAVSAVIGSTTSVPDDQPPEDRDEDQV